MVLLRTVIMPCSSFRVTSHQFTGWAQMEPATIAIDMMNHKAGMVKPHRKAVASGMRQTSMATKRTDMPVRMNQDGMMPSSTRNLPGRRNRIHRASHEKLQTLQLRPVSRASSRE